MLKKIKNICGNTRRDATSNSYSILQKSEAILNQQTEPKDVGCEENTVYIVQNISKKCYSVFYDTSCSDIVVRYHDVKDIVNREIQEIPGSFSIGGVGNSHVKSDHGIYQVKLLLHNGKDGIFSGNMP